MVEAEARLTGIRVEDIAIEEAAVKFDLELGMVEAGGEIRRGGRQKGPSLGRI